MDHYYMIARLGARIKELRMTREMTQDDLSFESAIEKSMISKLETGQSNPTIRTLYRISMALDVPLIEFFKD